MKSIQQIPSAKVVAIETDGQKRYVLCYSASMGYFISVSIKAEDVVICAANRTHPPTMFHANSQILFINESDNDELVTVYGSEVVDMNMMFPEAKVEEQKEQLAYRFVNQDGNYLRFNGSKGYYIDPNGPINQIVTVYDKNVADDFVMEMVHHNNIKNLNGDLVDSNLMVSICAIV